MTALKIAFRDLLNAKGFTLVFLLNLFLGVSGFVALQSFRDNVNDLLEQRARQLLSADLSVSGRRDLGPGEEVRLKEILTGKAEQVSKAVKVYSMAKAAAEGGRSRLVQLKAVESAYPFYGDIELKESKNHSEAMERLQSSPAAWLDPELLVQMDVAQGDKIKLGDMEFVVDDTVVSDSAASFGSAGLAPKIFISLKNLDKTGLVGFGSVATYARLIKLKARWRSKEKLAGLQEEIENALDDPGIRVKVPEGASEQAGRVLNYLSDYLGLVGLVALFLSGIGAGYLFQNHLFEKMEDVGVLKSLGMGLGAVFSIYIIQLAALSFFAVVLANVFAWGVLPAASAYFYEWIQIDAELSLSWRTFLLSFAVSAGTSVLVCAPILYKMVVRKTKNLFEGGQFFRWSFGPLDLALYLPLLLFMWGLSALQARSFAIGSVFTAALLIVVLAVSLIFPALLEAADKRLKKKTLRRPGSLSLGLAARYFVRDRLSVSLSICAIAVGTMLLSLIGQLEVSLKGELLDDSRGKPDLFLFDIQEEQKRGLVKLAREENIKLLDISPMIRSRILKVNGRPFKRADKDEGFSTREEEGQRRMRNRGVNLSFRQSAGKAEEIVEGRAFSGVYQEGEGLPELSIEKRYARRLGLELGDTMTFDILGLEIKGKIVNLRKVKWTSFLPNFFIVFQPGAIDDAPKTYLAAMGDLDFETRLEAQDKVVEKFPNISIVNVTKIIEKIMAIFKAMATALGAMASLCMLAGFFVLFAIIQNQLKKKAFEAAIQKVLGLEPKALMAALIKEYFLLAAVSCVIGLGFSLVLGLVVSEMFFDGVWRVHWALTAQIAAGVFAVVGILALAAGKTFYSLKARTLLR